MIAASLRNAYVRSFTRRLSTGGRQWHVAIVGSGPAGFYVADHLLKRDEDVRVSIFERLPVPFGLVRFGVAPDHQDVKNVTERFTQISQHPRVNLYCNVCIGGSSNALPGAALLPLTALQEHFDAVVLSCGAPADRTLSLTGTDLHGVSTARRFVEWYNGHPLAAKESFELHECETVVIVGNGNVAIDCARILSKGVDALRSSDISEAALDALSRSAVRQVCLLGRRGVLQAAFTIKELRELSKLPGVSTEIEAPADAFSEAVLAAAAKDRARKRLVDLMRTLSTPVPSTDASSGTRVRLQFQRAPAAFLSNPSGERLGAVRVQHTVLQGEPSSSQRAQPSGEEELVDAQLALFSVGYRSLPIEGAPFDEARAVAPNDGGRVTAASGLYASGWFKRGPNGVILTNVGDAAETAAAILEDRVTGALLVVSKEGRNAIDGLLRAQDAPVVDYAGWERINAEEIRRGAQLGKPREKITRVEDMLRAALG